MIVPSVRDGERLQRAERGAVLARARRTVLAPAKLGDRRTGRWSTPPVQRREVAAGGVTRRAGGRRRGRRSDASVAAEPWPAVPSA